MGILEKEFFSGLTFQKNCSIIVTVFNSFSQTISPF